MELYFSQFKNFGGILFVVEYPIKQLLLEISGYDYSIVGFYFRKDKDISIVLGDIFGVHFNRWIYAVFTIKNFNQTDVSKLISNVAIADFEDIATETGRIEIGRMIDNGIRLGINTHQEMFDTSIDHSFDPKKLYLYRWMTSLLGYNISTQKTYGCYETINRVLHELNDTKNTYPDNPRLKTELIKCKKLKQFIYTSYLPIKGLFDYQHKIVMEKKNIISELTQCFSELFASSPPFNQKVLNRFRMPNDIDRISIVNEIKNLIAIVNQLSETIEQEDTPVMKLNNLIQSLNSLSNILGVKEKCEIIDKDQSVGIIISTQSETDKIPVKFKNGDTTLIPTRNYDLSQYSLDECKEILLLVDVKSNGETIYETLKSDLTRYIAQMTQMKKDEKV